MGRDTKVELTKLDIVCRAKFVATRLQINFEINKIRIDMVVLEVIGS